MCFNEIRSTILQLNYFYQQKCVIIYEYYKNIFLIYSVKVSLTYAKKN